MARDRTSDCLFCAIATGDAPAHVIHRTDDVVAFLDIHPIRTGHVQIIPREHHAYFDDVPIDLMTAIMTLGQRLAPILRAEYAVERVALLFTGGDFPHAHAHVVPLVEDTDITSRRYIADNDVRFRGVPRADDAALALEARNIRSRMSKPVR